MIRQFRKKLGRIKRCLFKTNAAYWYFKPLIKNDCPRIQFHSEVRFEPCNFAETVQWIIDHKNQFPWIYNTKELDCAARYGHFFPSLKYQGDIIGFAKVALKRAYIEDYEGEIILNDDEAFIYDTFILPEFRKKHMGSFMLDNVFVYLQRRGIHAVFCHIPEWNIASSKLYLKMGFKRLCHVRYIRFLRFRYFSNRPQGIKERATKEIESFYENA